jgi:hypothetical protein
VVSVPRVHSTVGILQSRCAFGRNPLSSRRKGVKSANCETVRWSCTVTSDREIRARAEKTTAVDGHAPRSLFVLRPYPSSFLARPFVPVTMRPVFFLSLLAAGRAAATFTNTPFLNLVGPAGCRSAARRSASCHEPPSSCCRAPGFPFRLDDRRRGHNHRRYVTSCASRARA